MFAIFALTLVVLLSFGVAAIGCWLVLIGILRLTKCESPAGQQTRQRAADVESYSTLPLPAIEPESAPDAAPQ